MILRVYNMRDIAAEEVASIDLVIDSLFRCLRNEYGRGVDRMKLHDIRQTMLASEYMAKSDDELVELYHSIFSTGEEVKVVKISLYDENGNRNKTGLVLENEETIVVEDVQVEEEIAVTIDEEVIVVEEETKEQEEARKMMYEAYEYVKQMVLSVPQLSNLDVDKFVKRILDKVYGIEFDNEEAVNQIIQEEVQLIMAELSVDYNNAYIEQYEAVSNCNSLDTNYLHILNTLSMIGRYATNDNSISKLLNYVANTSVDNLNLNVHENFNSWCTSLTSMLSQVETSVVKNNIGSSQQLKAYADILNKYLIEDNSESAMLLEFLSKTMMSQFNSTNFIEQLNSFGLLGIMNQNQNIIEAATEIHNLKLNPVSYDDINAINHFFEILNVNAQLNILSEQVLFQVIGHIVGYWNIGGRK